MRTGADPDQRHLKKQDWVSELGWNRPEAVSSMGTGLRWQAPREQKQIQTRDICRGRTEPTTWSITDLRQKTPQKQVWGATAEQVSLSQDL